MAVAGRGLFAPNPDDPRRRLQVLAIRFTERDRRKLAASVRPRQRDLNHLNLHRIVRLIVEPHRAKESCAVEQLRVDVAQKVRSVRMLYHGPLDDADLPPRDVLVDEHRRIHVEVKC